MNSDRPIRLPALAGALLLLACAGAPDSPTHDGSTPEAAPEAVAEAAPAADPEAAPETAAERTPPAGDPSPPLSPEAAGDEVIAVVPPPPPGRGGEYIGLLYGELPEDLEYYGGTLLRELDGVDYAITEVGRGPLRMLWLDRLTHRGERGKPHREVLAVLAVEDLRADERLKSGLCSPAPGLDHDLDLVAIAEYEEDSYLTEIRRAWRIDRRRGRFVEIRPGTIVCGNDEWI